MKRALHLRLLEDVYSVARLDAGAPLPDWVEGEVTCVARTPAELSVVCAESSVPESVQSSGAWRCFEVAGPLDFSEVGILSTLTTNLAEAGVSVFAFSTFDTDYLMVRADALDETVRALQSGGHSIA